MEKIPKTRIKGKKGKFVVKQCTTPMIVLRYINETGLRSSLIGKEPIKYIC